MLEVPTRPTAEFGDDHVAVAKHFNVKINMRHRLYRAKREPDSVIKLDKGRNGFMGRATLTVREINS
jgi:hypothetical protein